MNYSKKIAEEYDRLKQKQLQKNADYGDSVFLNKRVLGVERPAAGAVLDRIGDKIARLDVESSNYMVDEKREETIDDLIGYLVCLQIINREKS